MAVVYWVPQLEGKYCISTTAMKLRPTELSIYMYKYMYMYKSTYYCTDNTTQYNHI